MTIETKLETQFYDNGETVSYVRANHTNRMEKLTPMVYRIKMEEDKSYVFEKVFEEFELPPKLFGKAITSRADMVMSYYRTKTKSSLGVMALGAKGCGKTDQQNLICNIAIKEDKIPVILVEKPVPKNVLESMIKAVGPCVVYFDEYEKTYSPNNRDSGSGDSKPGADELLTLFSDKTLDKVIFLITANRVHDISPYLLNRPARFLFRFNYSGTDKDVFEEVCKHFKLKEDVATFLGEYVEDTRCSTDVTIHLADIASGYKTADELNKLFDSMNAPKPKRYLWRVYTESGAEEGLKVEAARKMLIITHEESKTKWEINYDNFYKSYQYNQSYGCFVVSGLAGDSKQVKVGFMAMGAANPKEDEDIESVTFMRLESRDAQSRRMM